MFTPRTKYAKSGSINLAYQIIGSGEEYLILIPGWVSNVEEVWNIPQLAAWLRYLATLKKLIIFDKRGTGLSDLVQESDLPDIKQRADDLRIIMSEISIKKATFIGLSEGGPLAIYLAAHHPELMERLILVGSFAKWIKSPDYPFGLTTEVHNKIKDYLLEHWGKPLGLNLMAPSAKNDTLAQQQWAKFLRTSASPNTARIFYEMNMKIDVRNLLNKVVCPTLIMHRRGDRLIEYGHGSYLHDNIKGAQLLLTEGKDHFPWFSVKRNELIALQTFLEDGKASVDPKLGLLRAKDIFILYEVKNYIQDNFQKDITIKYLSRRFGINEYKIKSGFRSLFGSPVITFLSNVRLQNACELLMMEDETVSSISEKVGYTHPNNFSAAFKRKYKLSPKQYRAGK